MRLWDGLASPGAANETDAARDAAFVSAAFESILARAPTLDERAASEEFVRQQTTLFVTSAAPNASARARENFVHALLNHNDFLTVR